MSNKIIYTKTVAFCCYFTACKLCIYKIYTNSGICITTVTRIPDAVDNGSLWYIFPEFLINFVTLSVQVPLKRQHKSDADKGKCFETR